LWGWLRDKAKRRKDEIIRMENVKYGEYKEWRILRMENIKTGEYKDWRI
jgi:hypothetical protein